MKTDVNAIKFIFLVTLYIYKKLSVL